ncbi:hypothetical protein [Paraburkholderia ferrariae]|uniref:hypothetical protein n=1 Tax=Paraburkholderia ferrariae TaxID=386056 RepID=UPI0012EB284F|nr:hypothetical protein [Paraburkholderia ferrariae]
MPQLALSQVIPYFSPERNWNLYGCRTAVISQTFEFSGFSVVTRRSPPFECIFIAREYISGGRPEILEDVEMNGQATKKNSR